MRHESVDAEKRAALAVADLMAAAARTAPKGSGQDQLEIIILDGKEKETLTAEMRRAGAEMEHEFFIRDAGNVDASHCILIIGTRDIPLALDPCGLCGFENCGESMAAGSKCAFKTVDLGIAIGSAVSVAADHRMDNRVMFSAGIAARNLGLLSENVSVCFGIPLCTSGKSIFFDRAPGSVMC